MRYKISRNFLFSSYCQSLDVSQDLKQTYMYHRYRLFEVQMDKTVNIVNKLFSEKTTLIHPKVKLTSDASFYDCFFIITVDNSYRYA